MKSRRTNQGGFSFIAVIGFLAFLTLMAGAMIPSLKVTRAAQIEQIQGDFQEMSQAVEAYYKDNGTVPASLGELYNNGNQRVYSYPRWGTIGAGGAMSNGAPSNILRPAPNVYQYVTRNTVLQDVWFRNYQYNRVNASTFQLWSLGPDGGNGGLLDRDNINPLVYDYGRNSNWTMVDIVLTPNKSARYSETKHELSLILHMIRAYYKRQNLQPNHSTTLTTISGTNVFNETNWNNLFSGINTRVANFLPVAVERDGWGNLYRARKLPAPVPSTFNPTVVRLVPPATPVEQAADRAARNAYISSYLTNGPNWNEWEVRAFANGVWISVP